MSDGGRPPGAGGTYSEREAALVLRRAAQLQQANDSERAGTSLADLEQIAAEAGIDPRFVRQAALDVRVDRQARVSPWLGAPLSLEFERTLPGELPTSAFEQLTVELQRGLPPGQPSLIGRTLTFTTVPTMPQGTPRVVLVTISSAHGNTTVRVEERLGGLAGGVFGGIIGGFGGGFGSAAFPLGLLVLHSAAAAVGLFGVAVVGSWALARAAFGLAARHRAKKLEALFERLCRTAEGAIAQAAPPLPAPLPPHDPG